MEQRPKSVIFLYNPRSGRGRTEALAEKVCHIFRESGHTIKAQPIDFDANPFDGNEQIDLMVVAGGDGTINYVVNSMKSKGLDVELGIIPSGTANDFAGALGMSSQPLRAARQIAQGEVQRIDCGCVNGRYYVNVFSFGLFTTTSQHTSDEHKHVMGRFAYMLEGTKELASMHSIPLHVVADERPFDFNAQMVLIFNGETAGKFPLARGASIRDGMFDCIFVRKTNVFSSAAAMFHYLLGGNTRLVKHLRARTLDITSPVDEPTDVDGQPGAHFPLHIECLPGELRIVCPRCR